MRSFAHLFAFIRAKILVRPQRISTPASHHIPAPDE
jgi:hypothetical protein